MNWIIGGLGALVVFLFANKRASANPNNSQGAGNGRLAPLAAPAVPSPSLCQAAVTVGGVGVGLWYGVPPQVSLPVGALASPIICSMGAKVGNKAIRDTKASVKFGADTTRIAVSVPATLLKETLKVARTIDEPKKFVRGSVDLSKKTVTVPAKAVVKTTQTAWKYGKGLFS